MQPVIVHSFLGNRSGNAITNEQTKIFATCSQYYAKKNTGLKTILYTDELGAELFKDIPYDEIILFDKSIIEKLPKSIWSAGKILAMTMENRPFIHIDFDFFILNKSFMESVENVPFFAYHDEPWSAYFGKKNNFYKNGIAVILNVVNEYLNIDLEQKFISVNFSIFGSCVKNNIPIINDIAQKIIDCIIKYKDFLDSKELLEKFEKSFGSIGCVMIPIVIEQVLFMAMIKEKLKTYLTLIKIKESKESYPNGTKIGLIHLWDAKHFKEIKDKIDYLYNIISQKSNKNV
jgi:hypothetical protein